MHLLIKRLLTPIGLSIIFISPGNNLAAADFSIKESVILTRDKDSGLPGNTVLSVTGSKNGYLWLGTPSGLLRFDGLNFTTFNKENTSILTNDRIQALFMNRDGTLWIGTDGGGVYSLKNSVWKNYSTRNGLSNNHINSIVADFQGNIWIGTDYGLNKLSNGIIDVITTENGLYDNLVTSLTVDNRGVLWIGTLKGGLISYEETIVWHYGYQEGLKNLYLLSLTTDPIGNIWIGTMEGLYFLNREDESISVVRGTGFTPVSALSADEDGTIWIGTMADGLKWWKKGKLHSYSADDGFPDDYIHCIYRDDVGNRWLGTESAGLLQLRKRRIGNITRENGLPDDAISAVVADNNSNLWVGTRNDGLSQIRDAKTKKIYNRGNGLSNNRVRALLAEEGGIIWVGTHGGGINRIKNSRVSQPLKKETMPTDVITAFAKGANDILWVGTDRGLYALNTKMNRIEPRPDNILANKSIQFLHRGSGDRIYAGTEHGLFVITNNISTQTRAPDMDYISIFEFDDGSLLLGSNGSGLVYLSGDSVMFCTSQNGLPADNIFSITEDAGNNLWMSSYNGIFKISKMELLSYFSGTIDIVSPAIYDESDGMASSQSSGAGNPLCVVDEKNILYFATSFGVAVVDPGKIKPDEKPPLALIEKIMADGTSFSVEKRVIISDVPDIISISFTAIDFAAAGNTRFAYKLEGFHKQDRYVFPGQKRIATYRNLPPGEYRFMVKAISNSNIASVEYASIDLVVQYPFYREPLYQIIALGFLFLFAVAFTLIRQRKISRRPEKYHTSTLNSQTADDIIPHLLDLMDKKKIYLDPDLTLRELAAKLRIHYNHLSQIINTRFEMSYNDFVNKYRIEEVQRQLKDPANNDRTVLEIMYDCGFYSKSVFNTAFKKFTGMTPSQFRK